MNAGRPVDVAVSEAKHAIDQIARTIAVIIVSADGASHGMTVGTLSCPTYDPPRIAASLYSGSTTLATMKRAQRFTVYLLRDIQVQAALAFAGHSDFEPEPIRVLQDAQGSGYAARIECALESSVRVGEYELVIGRVLSGRVGTGNPLLQFRRSFMQIGGMAPHQHAEAKKVAD